MSRKPYIELPDILELLPLLVKGTIETEPVEPEVKLNLVVSYINRKSQDVSVYTLKVVGMMILVFHHLDLYYMVNHLK